jgi:hypothetical protein
MKKFFILITLFFVRNIYAQMAPTLEKSDPQIIAIDKTVGDIKNNINSFRKVERKADSTGYDRGYFLKSELQMVATYYKDTATEKHGEWYFENGQFIYSTELWLDVKTKDTIDYERFYLRNEHLIAWFKFDQPVDRNTVVFKKLNVRMSDYIAVLKKEYE